MAQSLKQEDFFNKYKITKEHFESSKCDWNVLEQIYKDYLLEVPNLEASAVYIFNSLMKTKNVHSVRYRVKDAEHVIEKIIRKSIKDPDLKFTIENYKELLTDLIGLRALHLFKDDWREIHAAINHTWNLMGKGVVNFRDGDHLENNETLQEMGLETKKHPYGYRSIHYIIETTPAKIKYYAEIQVRTIFEEAWSEIDHTIRYPYDQDNQIFGQFLLILNRLAGSADEMGTYVSFLKTSLTELEHQHSAAIVEKDNIIESLRDKISELDLSKEQSSFFDERFSRLASEIPLVVQNKKSPDYLDVRKISDVLSQFSRISHNASMIEGMVSPSLIDIESKFNRPSTIKPTVDNNLKDITSRKTNHVQKSKSDDNTKSSPKD